MARKTAPALVAGEVSETGVWLDAIGAIVNAEPAEGVLFIAPGVVVTAEHVERIEGYRRHLPA